MCFSAEVSFTTFLLGITGSALLVNLGRADDKILGFFLGFVSLMQGLEYLIWKNQKRDAVNQQLTITAMILNHLQPIVLGVLVLFFNPKTGYRPIILGILAIYAVLITLYSLQFFKDPANLYTIKGEKHLEWNWNGLPYFNEMYAVFLLTLCIVGMGIPYQWFPFSFVVYACVSYLTSWHIYRSEKVVGGLWCFWTSLLPFLIYGLRLTTI
jgi:hypothetical protein